MALYPSLPNKLPQNKSLIYAKTNVAGYFFDAFLRVDHTSKLNITEHPVETGANISDHAFIEPAELIIEIGMSDTAKSIVKGQFTGKHSRSVTAYQILKELQAQRIPLQIHTRLSDYKNMLVETISVSDDYTTLYALKATVTFREVIIASTKTVKISARPNTTDSTNRGNVEPEDPNQSVMYQGAVAMYGQDRVDAFIKSDSNWLIKFMTGGF
jgi:hypothetical protein